MKIDKKYLITGGIVLVAALFVLIRYWDYVVNPWTRDGQVGAYVIQVTPRVSGPIVDLPVKNDQLVKAGDVLFQIDPRTYEAALARAKAQLDQTGQGVSAMEKQVEAARAQVQIAQGNIQQAKSGVAEAESQVYTKKREYERQQKMLPKGSTSQKAVDQANTTYQVSEQQLKAAEASMVQAEAAVRQARAGLAQAQAQLGQLGEDNAQVRAAIAAYLQAELNLEFTTVRAPVDGYVTNLHLRYGSNTVANQPALALVDVNGYYIEGYFKETHVSRIKPGDRAVVTLMSYPGRAIEARVESVGWGISQQDGSTGHDLLPSVAPTYEWIRLAQRIPVRVHIIDKPEDIQLRVGTTCSVMVGTGTKTEPVPSAFQ